MKVSARSRWNVFGAVGNLPLLNSEGAKWGYVISRTQKVAQRRPIGCVGGSLCHCACLVHGIREFYSGTTGRCVGRETLGSRHNTLMAQKHTKHEGR